MSQEVRACTDPQDPGSILSTPIRLLYNYSYQGSDPTPLMTSASSCIHIHMHPHQHTDTHTYKYPPPQWFTMYWEQYSEELSSGENI